jgi:uncharacterized protein related to proFAR isomerase
MRAKMPFRAKLNFKRVFRFLIKLAVNFGDFLAPSEALQMAETHDIVMVPVHVIGNESGLLIDFLRRICAYVPASIKFMGISKFLPQ